MGDLTSFGAHSMRLQRSLTVLSALHSEVSRAADAGERVQQRFAGVCRVAVVWLLTLVAWAGGGDAGEACGSQQARRRVVAASAGPRCV